MDSPDYRGFARDLMKLCKKYDIKMRAYHEGDVYVGPAEATLYRDFPYSGFQASPTEVILGTPHEMPIRMTPGEKP